MGTPEMRWAFIRFWTERRESAGRAVMGGLVIASLTRNSKTSTWAKEACRLSPVFGAFSTGRAGTAGALELPVFKIFPGTMTGLRAMPVNAARALVKRSSPLVRCSTPAAVSLF